MGLAITPTEGGVPQNQEAPVLITTIAHVTCAVPVACVVETMRPLPTQSGICTHRGVEVRVLSGASLMGATTEPRRAVVLRVGAEKIALLVDDVAEVRTVSARELGKPAFELDASLSPGIVAVLRQVRVVVAS